MTEPAQPTSFTGRYTFSRDDYLALVSAVSPPSYGLRTVLATLWISVFVLIIGLMSRNWDQFVQAMHDIATFNEVPFFVYLLLFLGLVLIGLMPNLTLLRARRLYGALAIADQEITVVVDDSGLGTAAPGRQARMEWALVRRVVIAPGYLFLPISQREALLIPRRAFANDLEFAGVTALALRNAPKAAGTRA